MFVVNFACFPINGATDFIPMISVDDLAGLFHINAQVIRDFFNNEKEWVLLGDAFDAIGKLMHLSDFGPLEFSWVIEEIDRQALEFRDEVLSLRK